MTKTNYDFITEALIKSLDAGVAPWQRSWAKLGSPKNLKSGKEYRGINRLLLSCSTFNSPNWLTYKQAQALGGEVRKGEKGTKIVFWKIFEKDEIQADGSTDLKRIPFLRHYTVFNLEQIDGIEDPTPTVMDNFDPIEAAEQVWDAWDARPTLNHGGDQAYYRPSTDSIQMPPHEYFESAEAYYAVLFHEATHSTGAKKRLNRPAVAKISEMGRHSYQVEELVAEIGAMFLCDAVGIEGVADNSAAYIGHWRAQIKEEGARVILNAAQAAQKAADMVLGKKFATV